MRPVTLAAQSIDLVITSDEFDGLCHRIPIISTRIITPIDQGSVRGDLYEP